MSILATRRSASVALPMVVGSLAVLFCGAGSGSLPVTVATLVMTPGVGAVTVTTTVACAPEARPPSTHDTVDVPVQAAP